MKILNAVEWNLPKGAADPFLASPEMTSSREAKPGMRVRPMLSDGRRSATVLLSSSQCPAQVHSDLLQPSIAVAYERHAVDSRSGTFTVRISLFNRSPHVAHEPFLCLPVFGLQLTPAPGWTMQDVNSIRRLRRFGPERTEQLPPRASVHCCNIALLFNAKDGGRVEFDAGSRHSLDSLPDLRLTCVAGAGNYPSERLPLVVPAATLKGFLAELVKLGEVPDKPAAS